MANDTIYIDFPGRILFVGFGSIGQGVLPLILRHIGIPASRITIVTADDLGREEAERYGVKLIKQALTRENLRRTLDTLLGRGDFLLNLSVDVASTALIRYSWEKGAMYLDTCIEPWPGGYTDSALPAGNPQTQSRPPTRCLRTHQAPWGSPRPGYRARQRGSP